MPKPLTMAQVAERLGLHYDTFRKAWRDMRQGQDFPAPFLHLKWDADLVDAWINRRSQRGDVSDRPVAMAGHASPNRDRTAKHRAVLEALRAG